VPGITLHPVHELAGLYQHLCETITIKPVHTGQGIIDEATGVYYTQDIVFDVDAKYEPGASLELEEKFIRWLHSMDDA
jgi:hypothetical protein